MHEVQTVGPQALLGLQTKVQEVLDQAKKQGASACEVSVSLSQGLSTSVRQGEVETVEFNRDQGFGITLYDGRRKGSASTSSTDAQAIKETVAAALAIARHASEDEYSGLADASLMATQFPELDLWHPWNISPEQAIEQAQLCEQAALAFDARISNSEGASLNSHSSCAVYGNSHGLIAGQAGTQHSLSCVVIAQQQGQMQRDYWYDYARDAAQLMSPQRIGQQAAQRTVARLGARPVTTCKAPVMFSANVAAGLFGHFLQAISGGSLYRKSSFLLDALGQSLFPQWLSLYERPQLIGGLSSCAFDGDGLATYDKDFIEKGQLVNYMLSTYSGRKLGMPSTANAGGARNLFVTHGELDQTQIIKKMGRGLLVTELMGQGINMVTGDYSRGASGFWVENGEIQFPVEEVTIAGNLRDMFKSIVDVGCDLERRSSVCTGSVLLEQMMIAGRD
ncbi:metalloprotease PmbA [Pseudomonas sp. F1_0610]|uniref:metalloprotease PmbA n=1 Tax=Pseudomonas sp. F1_0610 TaxID=3114284 RepID=UPI0039C499BC